jgi:hypothetical protein
MPEIVSSELAGVESETKRKIMDVYLSKFWFSVNEMHKDTDNFLVTVVCMTG